MKQKSLNEFIDNDERFNSPDQDKREIRRNIYMFVFNYYKQGAPTGTVDRESRNELYRLAGEYLSTLLTSEREPTQEEIVRAFEEAKILDNPFISTYIYNVIKYKHYYHLSLYEDYEQLSDVINQALKQSELISKICCDYLESKSQNLTFTDNQKELAELLQYITSLGSPGLDLEVGELQYWNLVQFFNNLNDLKDKNLFLQELMQMDDSFF